MLTGMCEYQLLLPGAHSLKEKRSRLKSLQARLGNKFNAAICESGDQELWQRARIGIAVVGNERRHVENMLDNITAFIESFSDEIILLQADREIL